jgi:hypothetical protein
MRRISTIGRRRHRLRAKDDGVASMTNESEKVPPILRFRGTSLPCSCLRISAGAEGRSYQFICRDRASSPCTRVVLHIGPQNGRGREFGRSHVHPPCVASLSETPPFRYSRYESGLPSLKCVASASPHNLSAEYLPLGYGSSLQCRAHTRRGHLAFRSVNRFTL